MSLRRSIYGGAQPVIQACEFTAAELEEIINRSSMDDKMKELKPDPDGDLAEATNIVVTKYEDPAAELLDVEPALELDSKGKLIQVDLLPSSHLRNIQNKDNVSELLAKTKKMVKRKLEGAENKKMESEGKRRRSRPCVTCGKECVKNHDLMCASSPEARAPPTLCGALCSKCGKNFSSNYNLKRHMTSCKLCPDEEKGPRYVCQCGRTYSQEWDMKKHKMKCKEGKKKCKKCFIANCNLLFYHKAQLITHMKRDHCMSIQDPEILNFNSFEEFMVWKEREEEQTFTYYSKQTGSNVTGVSVNTYYVCQHDGSDRTHSMTPRKTERRNKKGRIKTGRLCWSQMNVKEFKDQTVRVTYFPSHTHAISSADTEHHPLPTSISMAIKRRLSDVRPAATSDMAVDESQDLKKPGVMKKKRFGMTVRALRSLARKNRNLFRITADAIQEAAPQPFSEDEKPSSVLLAAGGLHQDDNLLQVFVADHEENADDPEEMQFAAESKEEATKSRDEALADTCCSQLDVLRAVVESGKVDGAALAEISSALKDLIGKFGPQDPLPVADHAIADLQEVMYQSESPLPVSETYPLQDGVTVTNMELAEDLKPIEGGEKTIYQIVALDKDKTGADGSEMLYHNAVELVGTVGAREFIIIAGDHAQFFQSVDPNVQFDLNS